MIHINIIYNSKSILVKHSPIHSQIRANGYMSKGLKDLITRGELMQLSQSNSSHSRLSNWEISEMKRQLRRWAREPQTASRLIQTVLLILMKKLR